MVTAAIVTIALGAAMAGLGVLAKRARRRGTAGSAIAGAMAAYDEGMHGTAHDAFVELQQQDERVKPAEAPDN
ncbi:MAG: hypothetical protein KKH51_11705 [Actinobacteria bacterium]|nr:hypothetical protein [Actinomycetota bacterium]